MKGIDREYIDILRKHDSPTVCNVIELFEIRPATEGFLDHSIRALFPELPPMVGHAVTMKFKSSEPYAEAPPYNDIATHVQALLAVPAPRVFVTQDLDDGEVGASFGELVASTYMAFGCVGMVMSGGARDSVAVRKRKLPVFARSQNVSHGYPQCLALNVPVEVGGVTINPGDLLHGDADGVVTIPVDLASEIALMCEEFVAAEREWLDYVDSGDATPEGVRDVVARYGRFQKQAREEIRRKLAQTGK